MQDFWSREAPLPASRFAGQSSGRSQIDSWFAPCCLAAQSYVEGHLVAMFVGGGYCMERCFVAGHSTTARFLVGCPVAERPAFVCCFAGGCAVRASCFALQSVRHGSPFNINTRLSTLLLLDKWMGKEEVVQRTIVIGMSTDEVTERDSFRRSNDPTIDHSVE